MRGKGPSINSKVIDWLVGQNVQWVGEGRLERSLVLPAAGSPAV